MPNETNTVGATMELGRLRIENESLRQQNAELIRALRELLADKYLSDPINADRMANARKTLATVQS